jgi:hypothetical protein
MIARAPVALALWLHTLMSQLLTVAQIAKLFADGNSNIDAMA